MIKGLEGHSTTWAALKTWALAQISQHHRGLENASLADAETNSLRGRIAQLRDMLALADPDPAIPGNPRPDR